MPWVALAGQHVTPADVILLKRVGPFHADRAFGSFARQVPQTPPLRAWGASWQAQGIVSTIGSAPRALMLSPGHPV